MSEHEQRVAEIREAIARGQAALRNQARQRVDAIFTAIEGKQFSDADVEGPFDSIVLEDIRDKLMQVAMYRDLTEADVLQASGEHDRKMQAELKALSEFWQSCRAPSDDLRVYYVYNTADRKLTVFAKDAKCARFFAHRAGHILEEGNGHVMVMKPEVEAELRRSGKALGRALRAGYPGVVEALGQNVVMKDSERVYTPMTVVGEG